MAQINFAHLQDQNINFAVFDADARDRSTAGRQALLAQLTVAARGNGLRIDKSALAFVEHGRLSFFGTPDLVDYLATNGVPGWTHTLDM